MMQLVKQDQSALLDSKFPGKVCRKQQNRPEDPGDGRTFDGCRNKQIRQLSKPNRSGRRFQFLSEGRLHGYGLPSRFPHDEGMRKESYQKDNNCTEQPDPGKNAGWFDCRYRKGWRGSRRLTRTCPCSIAKRCGRNNSRSHSVFLTNKMPIEAPGAFRKNWRSQDKDNRQPKRVSPESGELISKRDLDEQYSTTQQRPANRR